MTESVDYLLRPQRERERHKSCLDETKVNPFLPLRSSFLPIARGGESYISFCFLPREMHSSALRLILEIPMHCFIRGLNISQIILIESRSPRCILSICIYFIEKCVNIPSLSSSETENVKSRERSVRFRCVSREFHINGGFLQTILQFSSYAKTRTNYRRVDLTAEAIRGGARIGIARQNIKSLFCSAY